MNVLMITGDKSFGPGHPRFELQKSAVGNLVVVYWGPSQPKPLIPEGSFDVVTSQDPFWRGLIASHVARKKGARLNIQVHTDLSAQPSWRRMLARHVLRRADSVRVVSQNLKEQVEHIGVRAKVSVLPVYVDIPKFSSVIRKPHASKNILWIGRLEEEKNPLEAISILEEVLKSFPDAQLTILGVGTMTDEVIKKANNRPIIQILGWQNPITYFDTADVVLCTSWHESWGASIVEALAAGVPVVAPDVGIASVAGAIVVPRERLSEAVARVLRSGARGELKIPLRTKDEWVQAWKESLQ